MRHSLILAVSILLGFLALGILWQPAPAQQKREPAPAQQKAEPGPVDRYRVRRISDTWFVLVDSMTGRCWGRTAGAHEWNSMGAPVK